MWTMDCFRYKIGQAVYFVKFFSISWKSIVWMDNGAINDFIVIMVKVYWKSYTVFFLAIRSRILYRDRIMFVVILKLCLYDEIYSLKQTLSFTSFKHFNSGCLYTFCKFTEISFRSFASFDRKYNISWMWINVC